MIKRVRGFGDFSGEFREEEYEGIES
jgi:hypothetical protein